MRAQTDLFNLKGHVIAVTGGSGVLGSAICKALAKAGAKIAILARSVDKSQALADEIIRDGGIAMAVPCDVLEKSTIEQAADDILDAFGRIDALINCAGGNQKGATTNGDLSFFDLDEGALKGVFDLNIIGTILPSQVFGKYMAENEHGTILNVSSMAAISPLTRIPAYSAAKAGINNFTQWLAVHMAQEYSPDIRVNAIAPGFFLTEQNRFLLTDEATGVLTPRGKSIIEHTPMNRFGDPEELVGAVLWLLSDASRFVTGIIVPIDGGFSAFSGV
ncbi:MAG: SDR family oxidoreductase [Anaerolineae bacterium]|jgi:NAD(P)-dependent dehydrogenase (short-subunit alcohol dehydrogenase family)|nr:SDR family oxidoreductase [Anaerolineae bacterium]